MATEVQDQFDAARRIVELHGDYSAEAVREQRKLWDRFYPGRPYEDVRRDVWLSRYDA